MGFTRHFRALIIAGLVSANLMVLGLAVHSLVLSRQQYDLRARAQTHNVAVAIEQSMANSIAKIDLMLRVATDELERQLASGGIDERQMGNFIARQEERLPELEAIRVANAEGLVILGRGLKKEERPSWADRDYFLTLRENPDAGLQISKPRIGRVAKKYIIGFSRRYNTPDGRFAGVVSAPMTVEHLTTLISRFDLGPKGSIALRDSDLGLIARHPQLTEGSLSVVGNRTVSPELRDLIERGIDEATYHAATASDNIERIISLRRMTTAPMFILTGMASQDYLADWRQELKTKAGLFASFALLSLLSGVFLLKLIDRILRELNERRQIEAIERRRRSSHQRLNEIAAATHMSLTSQLQQALLIGTEHLGLEFGIVSQIEGDVYQVLTQVSPPGSLSDGQTFPLGDTYCSIVLAAGKVIAIADMAHSSHAGHPCYRAFKLEAYIGAPILVEGRIVGTVNFSSTQPYARPFDEGDLEFIEVLARWTGSAIERDRAQKRLTASQLHLQTIVETEPECVKVVAPDGTLLQMNRAGLDMVEADTLEQVAGQSVYQLIAPEWRDRFIDLNERVMQGASDTMEFEVLGLKGTRRWLETHAVPLRDGDGHVTGQLAVTRDISLRKQTETALRDAMRKAEAANVAKSQFLATMSHEIRTPLNGILGMAQLLMMPGLSAAESRDYARTILSSGQTLLTLLNDILDLSKVDAGKLALAHQVFDPLQLLEETAALHGEAAQSKHLALDCAWNGPPGQYYQGDPIRLRQMLSNLVSNAIKFTDAGNVRIEATEQMRENGNAILAFAVTDTGSGIPEEQLPLLFQPFTQLDGSATRRHGGTGLGLSIVRRLAELMNGTAEAESVHGQGASFRFTVRVERVIATADATALTTAALPPSTSSWRKAPSILLAEDNETNRMVVETLLSTRGCTVVSAVNGRVAVDMVTRNGVRPDLILMDCQMPEMNGFDATQAIRAWERENQHPRLPIIALTAAAFQEDRNHCLAVGMDDFLAKPVDLREMVATLEKWLRSPDSALLMPGRA